MHELSIMQGIFDIVMENASQHQLTRIKSVYVVVGDLSGVEPDALRFAFDFFAQNTPAEGAEFVIKTVPITGKCRRCGEKLNGFTGLKCRCDGPPDYQLLTGRELYVDTITGEDDKEESDNEAGESCIQYSQSQ